MREVIEFLLGLAFFIGVVFGINKCANHLKEQDRKVKEFQNSYDFKIQIDAGFGLHNDVFCDSLVENGRYTDVWQDGKKTALATYKIITIVEQKQ